MAIACAEFFRTAFLKKKPFLFLEVVLSFLLFLLPSYTVHKCALFCIEYIDIYRGGLILHKHRVCFPLTPTPGIQHFHFIPNHSLCSSVHSLAFLSTHSSPQPPSPVPSASLLAHIHLFVLHMPYISPNWRCSQQLQLPVHPSSGLLYNRQRMLVCVCAWEVLRSGEDKAKEDQGVMQVFIAGKTLQRALEKAAQAQTGMMLMRGCWPSRIWGAGFVLSIAFSGEATAASGCSTAVHSLFLLLCPALAACRRWDCSTGSASSLLHQEKKSCSLQQHQSRPVLG